MPTMFFAKDGSRPNTQRGPGLRLCLEEAQAIFGTETIQYVGMDAPSINPSNPSHSIKNVVLEVEKDEELSPLLPKIGFYVVLNITPEDANVLLVKLRNTA